MSAPARAVRIAAMTAQHAAEVLAIYQAGIDEGNATFETTAPSWEAFDTSLPIAASSALPGSAW